MADEAFWTNLDHLFRSIPDGVPPMSAHFRDPLAAPSYGDGAVEGAPDWQIVNEASASDRAFFVRLARAAVAECECPPGEWWRWLDWLREYGQDYEGDETSGCVPRLLEASARLCFSMVTEIRDGRREREQRLSLSRAEWLQSIIDSRWKGKKTRFVVESGFHKRTIARILNSQDVRESTLEDLAKFLKMDQRHIPPVNAARARSAPQRAPSDMKVPR